MHTIPMHIDSNHVYLRMKALSWIANKSFMPATVQSSAGKLLADIIKKSEPDKQIVVNFSGISNIEDHSLDAVNTLLKECKKKLVFINASHLAVENQISCNPVSTLHDGVIIYNEEKPSKHLRKFISKIPEIENIIIKTCVKESFHKHDKMERLKSTPILASGVFNAGSIVSDRKKFIWTCLLMADKLKEIMNQFKPKAMVRLLAVSLRASPFAGAIGILESFPIEIVDHMGPDLKILEEYTLRVNQEKVEYVYVGDFVIGGTELKIAETYAVARGCYINHAILIGSLLKPSEYEGLEARGRVKIHPLIQLKEANPAVKYSICQ